jgi:formylglycine-generating enzyme required for sulfatase activity
MSQVFISYRRDDSADAADRIYERLVQEYGAGNVVMDVESIPPGADFREFIGEAVGRCRVLLAVIGPRWLTILTQRREKPLDFVRLEIEAALQRRIPIIPTLVSGALMPGAGQLPPSLQELAFRNGLEVRRGRDFHRDVDRLLSSLDRWLKEQAEPAVSPPAVPAPLKEARLPGPGQAIGRGEPPPAVPAPPKEVLNSLGMKFAWIPPGTFLMGSPKSEVGRGFDETQHGMTLTQGFYLGVHQVTQAQWQAVMGSNPSKFTGDNLPVETVSWDDCHEFCKKLTDRENKLYRLPTEAEWEYACRAGTATAFSFGETISTDQANYNGKRYLRGEEGVYRGMTTSVGSFPPNAWGLYDMHGNVREWCEDWYGNYSKGDFIDYECYDNGNARILRGGCWNSDPVRCRAAARAMSAPSCRGATFGCRVALRLK